ncbi:MAG: tetratricopeptide repeat protein [Thermoguttaceae bacterium]
MLPHISEPPTLVGGFIAFLSRKMYKTFRQKPLAPMFISKMNCFLIGVFSFFLIGNGFLLVSAESTPTESPPNTKHLTQLIEKLGNESYIIRKRSMDQLLRMNELDYSFLRRFDNHDDPEISRAIALILATHEATALGKESETVQQLIELYASATDTTQKGGYIWDFAHPIRTFLSSEEKLYTLCRIAFFESNELLRTETIKCLLAGAPPQEDKRYFWFRTLRQRFAGHERDSRFHLVFEMASLYCDIEDAISNQKDVDETVDDSALKKNENSVQTDTQIDDQKAGLQKRCTRLTEQLISFQNDTEKEQKGIKSGGWPDILALYFLAEMCDKLEMVAERDSLIHRALKTRTSQVRQSSPFLAIDPLEPSSFNDHFVVGVVLWGIFRLQWAQSEFQLVIDEGDIVAAESACSYLSALHSLKCDPTSAIQILEHALSLIASEEYIKRTNEQTRTKTIAERRARLLYFQALAAIETEKWDDAAQLIEKSLEHVPTDVDVIILRYKITEKFTEQLSDEAKNSFSKRNETLIAEALRTIERQVQDGVLSHASLCNQAAWLLANTNGNFDAAMLLMRVALDEEPKSIEFLDTLAHVYALDKKFDKAIKTQKLVTQKAPESVLFQRSCDEFQKSQ